MKCLRISCREIQDSKTLKSEYLKNEKSSLLDLKIKIAKIDSTYPLHENQVNLEQNQLSVLR